MKKVRAVLSKIFLIKNNKTFLAEENRDLHIIISEIENQIESGQSREFILSKISTIIFVWRKFKDYWICYFSR